MLIASPAKSKNLFAKLRGLDGAVNEYYNPHLDVIRSASPSLNFAFGNGHGLPAGFSLLLWGPPKGGKSLVTNTMIGQLQQDDPDAYVVKFNTERREIAQLNPQQMKSWGIDKDRYLAYETNTPDQIYDYITKDIAAMCEEGLKLKLVVIDSINDITGRRAMNSDTVMTQQIGDKAATNQDGLGQVLAVQRKYRFGLIIVCQQRAEMDMAEQMRGNKTKAGVAYAVHHHCEYSMHVERNVAKAGQTGLEGKVFEDETVSRVITGQEGKKADGDKIGHKIRAVMKDSSMGPKGRVGEFTIEYDKGIVNVHEEVFLLGVNRNIIEHPNNVMYAFGGKEWKGKKAMLDELRSNVELQNAILKELRARDARGDYAEESLISEASA
jgi:RecA/RadA recombinase